MALPDGVSGWRCRPASNRRPESVRCHLFPLPSATSPPPLMQASAAVLAMANKLRDTEDKAAQERTLLVQSALASMHHLRSHLAAMALWRQQPTADLANKRTRTVEKVCTESQSISRYSNSTTASS